ncbi:MAG: hypothetical protein KGQ59_07360 [Bdellovibrionales bacterium]|nr:hypothetical protein [Bdellovibrionales bacterium]
MIHTQGPSKHVNRIQRALTKAEALTSVPIEVLIFSNTNPRELVERINMLAETGLSIPGQIIIGVDPVRRHVAVGLSPEIEESIDRGELRAWLKGLQDDLHMTFFENAVGLAVLSIAMAFSKDFPPAVASE